ncbi:unnamed protein product [Calypogeia fissa]
MASLAARTAHTVSRSWSSAVAGVSRSLGGTLPSSVFQYRTYSDEGLGGHVPLNPEASSAADPLSGTPLSGEFPQVIPKADPFGGESPQEVPKPDTSATGRPLYERNLYPPRNYRTPRGVYKAIVLGEVGQLPIQKVLKSGKSVTIFSVGTGGMYNNRKPFEGETPEEFAERSYTQWHRVAVYQDRLSSMIMQHVKVGSQVYLEGNIESRVYNDPNSGMVKRIREIAIRANGRLMFMDTQASRGPAQPAAGDVPPFAPASAA